MNLFKSTLMIMLVVALAAFAPLMASGTGTFTNDGVVEDSGLEGGKTFFYQCTVDSLDTLTSNSFLLAKYDSDLFSSYPVMAGYKFTSVTDTPIVSVILETSFDDTTWFACDTLASQIESETPVLSSLDLNSKFGIYFRWKVYGHAGNPPDSIVRFWFYVYRPEFH